MGGVSSAGNRRALSTAVGSDRQCTLTMPLTLLGRQNPLASTKEQLRILDESTCPPFESSLAQAGLQPLHATGITVFQINVGKLCNQTCRHCHVDAGPERGEVMSREI